MRQPTSGRRKTITATVGHRRSGGGTIPMGLLINGQCSTGQRVDNHKGRFMRAEPQYHQWMQSHTSLNPKRIVPLGPIIDFNAAPRRECFN